MCLLCWVNNKHGGLSHQAKKEWDLRSLTTHIHNLYDTFCSTMHEGNTCDNGWSMTKDESREEGHQWMTNMVAFCAINCSLYPQLHQTHVAHLPNQGLQKSLLEGSWRPWGYLIGRQNWESRTRGKKNAPFIEGKKFVSIATKKIWSS